MNKTIAVHHSPTGGEQVGDKSWGGLIGCVAVTEYVTVDFPDLDAKEYVPKQVAALKERRSELQEKYLEAKAHIDDQISKLTSITHQPEEES